MTDRLKTTIQWTLFILMLLFVLFFVVAFAIETFCPNATIAVAFKDFVGRINIVIGLLSTILGIWSLVLANKGNNQVSQILETVRSIEGSQKQLSQIMKNSATVEVVVKGTTTNQQWDKDVIKE